MAVAAEFWSQMSESGGRAGVRQGPHRAWPWGGSKEKEKKKKKKTNLKEMQTVKKSQSISEKQARDNFLLNIKIHKSTVIKIVQYW